VRDFDPSATMFSYKSTFASLNGSNDGFDQQLLVVCADSLSVDFLVDSHQASKQKIAWMLVGKSTSAAQYVIVSDEHIIWTGCV
jgi:hypothetical protein